MDKLKQIKLLGEGAFGKCYLCENPVDKSQWVVKQVDISNMSPQEKKEAYHEAKIMSAFDHPNIIKFIDIYTTTNGKLNIVMNYADGGDLSGKVRAQRGKLFTENEILDLFVQVLLAIKHVHDRKVLHRDIKAQNIFLMKSGLIKLGDFGISKVLCSTMDKARTMVGTPYYLSPEIVENRPYSFKSDVWSLGVLLYELCTLKPPFDGTSIRHLGLNIVRGIYPPIPPHFSRDLKMLIAQMLTVDSNRRPTVAQVLRMPFIKSRIQNLLSESVRFEEFSHTILHKQPLFNQKGEVNKDLAKKEIPRPEVKKEPPRPEVKKEPAKYIPEKIATPKFRPDDEKEIVNRFFEAEKPKIYQPQEIPKYNEPKEIKKLIEARDARIAEKAKIVEKAPKPKPSPPAMQGKLEDCFKPVDKPVVKKVDVAMLQAREDAKKKKELEVKKKMEEIAQRRENAKQEILSRQEAADKKKIDRKKKIEEEREKMLNDIKKKKNERNSSQPWPNEMEEILIDKKPIMKWPSDVEDLGGEDNPANHSKKNEKKAQYKDQRKKMLEDLRQKPKSNNEEFKIEWFGYHQPLSVVKNISDDDEKVSSSDSLDYSQTFPAQDQENPIFIQVHESENLQSPDQKRLYEILQEAFVDDSSEDEIYITQIPDEEIIDRIDEIALSEVLPYKSPVEKEQEVDEKEQEVNEKEEEIGSSYNSLEAMRDFLEEKMGCKMLLEAYSVMKNMGDVDPLEIGYSIFFEKLGTIIPIAHIEEYVSYLRTLIILENHADNYLEGLLQNR